MVESWHRRLCRITGQMSIFITRKRMSRSSMLEFAKELRRIAEEIEKALVPDGDTS